MTVFENFLPILVAGVLGSSRGRAWPRKSAAQRALSRWLDGSSRVVSCRNHFGDSRLSIELELPDPGAANHDPGVGFAGPDADPGVYM